MAKKFTKFGVLFVSRAHGRLVVETSYESESTAKERVKTLEAVKIQGFVVPIMEVD